MLARCTTIFMLLGLLLGTIAAPIMDRNVVAVEARGSSSTDGVVGTEPNWKRADVDGVVGTEPNWKRGSSEPNWKRGSSEPNWKRGSSEPNWKRGSSEPNWKRGSSGTDGVVGTEPNWKRQGSGHSIDSAEVEGQAL